MNWDDLYLDVDNLANLIKMGATTNISKINIPTLDLSQLKELSISKETGS